MIPRPPTSTRHATLLPYTTLFRSLAAEFRQRQIDQRIIAGSRILRRRLDVDHHLVDGITGGIGGDLAHLVEQLELHAEILEHQIRSEEHTSELQSLMRISYAVFCLKKNINKSNSNSQYKYII